MSHGRAHNRLHRWLAKESRRQLRKFIDNTLPKDVFLAKFKERKQNLVGT
jgi:hypothetical protein